MWGLVGFGGQYAYNVVDARHTEEVIAPKVDVKRANLLDRTFNSGWNPVKKLTDEEYETMLNGKLLAVEAELAITNEEIGKVEAKIRQQLGSEKKQ